MRLAVFASGLGSNMLAIARAIKEGKLPGVIISLVVCDKPSAPVLEHARKMELSTFIFESKNFSTKNDYVQVCSKRKSATFGTILYQ